MYLLTLDDDLIIKEHEDEFNEQLYYTLEMKISDDKYLSMIIDNHTKDEYLIEYEYIRESQFKYDEGREMVLSKTKLDIDILKRTIKKFFKS